MLASSKRAGKKQRRAEKLAALQERGRNVHKSEKQRRRGFAGHLVRSESCWQHSLALRKEDREGKLWQREDGESVSMWGKANRDGRPKCSRGGGIWRRGVPSCERVSLQVYIRARMRKKYMA